MTGYKLFMDPVYDEFIMVEKKSPMSEIINSPLMQRLRYIRQLGPCYYIYPGAEHTRFQHSLGVFWLTKKALNFLEEKGFKIDRDLKTHINIAALIHDMGHSPFSHALEKTIINYDHETMTVKAVDILMLNKVIDRKTAETVKKILTKTHSLPYSYQLISSQLDCDRLDYLRRDAFYTGVSFGKVDVNRILVSIMTNDNNIVWDYKGFNALESYVMSRYQMYWTVYFHRVNISAQVLLRKIVERLKEVIADDPLIITDPLLRKALVENDTEAFFMLTDANIIATIYHLTDSKDRILKDLSKRFIERRFFKLFEIQGHEMIFNIREKLEKLNLNHKYYMTTVEPSKVAYSYYSPSGTETILVNINGNIEEISNVAPTDTLKSLSRKVKKSYVVVPPEVG